MGGTVFSDAEWKGKLSGVEYATGPGYRATQTASNRIRVKVTNEWSSNVKNVADEGASIRNILAVVPGSVERGTYRLLVFL